MKNRFFLMSLAFSAMMLAAHHASARPMQCSPHAQIVEQLGERYGESRQSIGLTHDNTVLELFAAPDTGSWTITITEPGGPTCLVASGQNYQYLNEPLANFDSRS